MLNEWGLSIGPDSSQSEYREWVTGKLLCLSALTWYFTWLSSDPASHYLSNTIIVSCELQQSRRSSVFGFTQKGQDTMAVANFHYITRMSSGFKVYILEGKLHCHFSFINSYCWMRVNLCVLPWLVVLSHCFGSVITLDCCILICFDLMTCYNHICNICVLYSGIYIVLCMI